MAGTIKYVAVEVAGKPSPSKLLHRDDCGHLRDVGWPEPVLRKATNKELGSRRECQTCQAREVRERRP